VHVRRFGTCLAVALLGVLVGAPGAAASEIVGRDARDVRLRINSRGVALVTWRDPSGFRKVLAWGAVNARHPSPTVRQVKFRLDYSGGSYSFGGGYWRRFRDASQPYDGPRLPWLVTARKAPDGSYWALQSWRRMLPNWGYKPWTRIQRAWELRLSHWTTQPAKLEIWTDWVANGSSHHLFGRYTYLGVPVHGFGATRTGNPTDSYGRNVYVDTYNSAYGSGWKRENSFLTHRPNGNFCYGFYRHRGYDGRVRPKGHGAQYRATVIGPGVTPDVMWTGAGLPDYDPSNPQHVAYEAEMNALGRALIEGDPDDNCTAQ
jgi:hypothetical protein